MLRYMRRIKMHFVTSEIGGFWSLHMVREVNGVLAGVANLPIEIKV